MQRSSDAPEGANTFDLRAVLHDALQDEYDPRTFRQDVVDDFLACLSRLEFLDEFERRVRAASILGELAADEARRVLGEMLR